MQTLFTLKFSQVPFPLSFNMLVGSWYFFDFLINSLLRNTISFIVKNVECDYGKTGWKCGSKAREMSIV